MTSTWIQIGNLLSRSPFSSSKKRPFVETVFQETMRYERSPVKASQLTRRRMMLSLATAKFESPYEGGVAVADRHEGARKQLECPREERFTARMENYLSKNDCLKLDIEELEPMMSPEDSEVNLMYILMNASRRSSNIFEIFSTKEKSEHLVASKVRLQKRQRQREEISCEKMPIKAPPNTWRRMMLPTQQQSSHSSTEERRWQAETEVQDSFLECSGKGRPHTPFLKNVRFP